MIPCQYCKKDIKDCLCLHPHYHAEKKKAPRCVICCKRAEVYYTPDGNSVVCDKCFFQPKDLR